MLINAAHIRTTLGEPMTPAEIDAHVGLAADVFFRGRGYRGEGR